MTGVGTEHLLRFFEFSPGPLQETRCFFAPGRVNLIGEHVDYNGGDVLPIALELGTWLFVRPRLDGIYRFASTSFPEQVEVQDPIGNYENRHGFANYPKGVLRALAATGVACSGGGDFFYHSNLPSGAGLSSSAAIEVVTAFAVVTLSHDSRTLEDLAMLAQRVENEYVGVQCGIMDQFAVALGRTDAALLLHCRDLTHEYIPLRLNDYEVVIVNSNKQRSLVQSAYNQRRQECERALELLQRAGLEIEYLTDLSPSSWSTVRDAVDDPILARRVDHIVSEQERVGLAVLRLKQGDATGFGRLLNASHNSLQHDFEVTGRELDVLVEACQAAPGCAGARMTGAGFGGCAVGLVKGEAIDEFRRVVSERYEREIGISPCFYESGAGAGVQDLTSEFRMKQK